MSELKSKTGSSGVPDALREALALAAENRSVFRDFMDDLDKQEAESVSKRTTTEYRSRLSELGASYCDAQKFEVGNLIEWKEGLKNKRRPEYMEPCTVIEVLDPPAVSSSENPGSSYFRETLDLRIGVLDEDEELLIYHVDSRRFKICTQTVE